MAIETLQGTLESTGYSVGESWITGSFGSSTKAALKDFQKDHGLSASGTVDGPTLAALDAEARGQLDQARESGPAAGDKQSMYRLWADISEREDQGLPMALWVIDQDSGEPVVGYQTSPGREGYETEGDGVAVQQTMPRSWWTPTPDMPDSEQRQAPGVGNPMGLLKLHWFYNYQAIHGAPYGQWGDLGVPASSGCLRLSGLNILHLHENYAEAGTWTDINRDPEAGAAMWEQAAAVGAPLLDLEAGTPLVGAYLGAELGRDEFYSVSEGFRSQYDPDRFRSL